MEEVTQMMWFVVFEVKFKGSIEQIDFSVMADNKIQSKFKANQMLALKFPLPGMILASKIIKAVKVGST
jgi:hypothetical protein